MPYQRYAHILSGVLVLLVVYLLLEDTPAEWFITLAAIVATLVLAAALLNAWFLYREYRRGELFFVNNLTLYVSVFTLLLFPFLLASNNMGVIPGWFFYCLLFYHATENLFRVRLDQVSMTIKSGFLRSQEIPLFSLKGVRVEEDFIEARLVDGQQFRLERRRFFARGWARLQNSMEQLATNR